MDTLYDVVVSGAGPAGWTAAVAAARAHLKTALIDKYSFIGGTATASQVVPISGYFKNEERIVGGVPWEFIEKLEELGRARVEMPKGHVSVDLEYYKLVAGEMVHESGVDFFSNSYITGVERDGNTVKAVNTINKNGPQSINGKFFIDATGDGDVCHYMGMPMVEREDHQPLSMCFTLTGVDVSTPLLKDYIHHDGKNAKNSAQMIIHNYLEEEYEKGNCPNFGGPWFNSLMCSDLLAVNITRSSASALDAEDYSEAEYKLRKDMFTFLSLLKKKYPEFKNAEIASSAINAGIRETRTIVGAYELKGDDIRSNTIFPDTIALSGHPMDIHKSGSNTQILIKTDYKGHIPLRSLYNPEYGNIIAAGRNISMDASAYSSVRVQATASAIGQAAAVTASIALKNNCAVSKVDSDEVRKILVNEFNAIV